MTHASATPVVPHRLPMYNAVGTATAAKRLNRMFSFAWPVATSICGSVLKIARNPPYNPSSRTGTIAGRHCSPSTVMTNRSATRARPTDMGNVSSASPSVSASR